MVRFIYWSCFCKVVLHVQESDEGVLKTNVYRQLCLSIKVSDTLSSKIKYFSRTCARSGFTIVEKHQVNLSLLVCYQICAEVLMYEPTFDQKDKAKICLQVFLLFGCRPHSGGRRLAPIMALMVIIDLEC